MIRLATPADLSQAADIYEEILDREAQGPVYTNWQRGKYPTIDTARQALEAGTFYVGEEDGVLWGVVNLNSIQLPEYGAIPWTIPAAAEEVGVDPYPVHPSLLLRPGIRPADGGLLRGGGPPPGPHRHPAGHLGGEPARQPPVPLPGLPLRRNGGVLLHGVCAGESQLLRKGPLNPLGRKGFSPLLTAG